MLVRRYRGAQALRGSRQAGLAGLGGAVAGGAAGLGVTLAVPAHGFLPNVALTLMAGAAVLAAFLTVVTLADGGDLRAAMRRVIRT
jgi:hypothetical protein